MIRSCLTTIMVPLLLLGCAASPGGDTPTAGSSPRSSARLTATSLAESLRRAGLTVEDAGVVEQPFFSVPARVYQIDGRDLQVYEFKGAAEAEAAASQVSSTAARSAQQW